jgi:excisionase family DNA binding protein
MRGEFGLLTVNELRDQARVSRQLIYREIADGRLIPTRIGGRTFFAQADIDAWLLSCRRSATNRRAS